jgi:hypothetical protein
MRATCPTTLTEVYFLSVPDNVNSSQLTQNSLQYVRSEVVTAASMKMAVFWVLAPVWSEVLAASIIRAMSTHRPDSHLNPQ